MARTFIISTRYKSDSSQVEKSHSRMSKSFGRFATNLADGNSMIGKSFGRMNTAINKGLMITMTALIASVGLATNEYIKFDQAITQTVAKFSDVDIGTQKYIETQKLLAEESRRVASVSEFSATALAGAADKYAMAGINSEQTLKLLAGTTDLATAAGVDLVTAVDIATDSLGAFGKMTSDTIQLEKNLAEISDQMAKTTTTANTSLTELFEAVGNGAKTFTDAGQTMATFNAAAGLLANSSIKGGEAGTALRNVMLRLSKPTSEAQKALDALGVSTQDRQGNFRDIADIIADFETGLKDMGTAEKTAALATVFGARTVNSFNVLLGEGSDKLKAYRSQLENSTGASNEMAEAMRKSLASQIEILKSGLIELGFQFVEAFEKDGRGALQGIIDFIQNVDITPLIKFSETVVDIFKFLAQNWKILLAVAGGIKGIAIAMGVLNIATNLFNITLSATPVGITLASVGALIAIIILLATHWDKVVEITKKVGNWFVWLGTTIIENVVMAFQSAVSWISETGQKFTGLLGPIGFVVSALIEIAKQWDNIKNAFQTGGILSGIMAIGKALLSGLLAPMQGFLELISNIPGIGNLAETGALKLEELRAGLTTPETNITTPEPSFNIPAIGTPETPTPTAPLGSGTAGSLDINIRNTAGENAEIKQKGNVPTGTNINFRPSYGL